MTIATTSTFELTIDQVVRQAFVLAGLLSEYQPVDSVKGAFAKQKLDTIVKELENEGIFAKSVAFETVSIVSGQYIYTLSTGTLDAFGVAMWVDPLQAAQGTAANSELAVPAMGRMEWQTITTKAATGRPLKYYCHREPSPPEVYFWPTPSASEDGGAVRFQVHRFRADATDGNATLDYEKTWTQYFITRLAHDLSLGAQKPIERLNYLMTMAGEQKRKAKLYSGERPAQRFTVGTISGMQRR